MFCYGERQRHLWDLGFFSLDERYPSLVMARSRRRMRQGGSAAKASAALRVGSVSRLADEALGVVIGAMGVFLLFSLLSTRKLQIRRS